MVRGFTHASVESSRVGVVKALVDRAVTLRSHEGDMVEVRRAFNDLLNAPLKFPHQAVCSAFELKTPGDRLLFAPCVLHLTTLSVVACWSSLWIEPNAGLTGVSSPVDKIRCTGWNRDPRETEKVQTPL